MKKLIFFILFLSSFGAFSQSWIKPKKGFISSNVDPITNITGLTFYVDAINSPKVLSGTDIHSITDISRVGLPITASAPYPQWNATKKGIDFSSGSTFTIALNPGISNFSI